MDKIKVIIADDSDFVRDGMRIILEVDEDFEVIGCARNGREAIEIAKESTPDIFLMDIQMPDLNGLELARLIPEDTRIIFTSAFRQYAFESYEVEALDYILKPIRYQKFLEAVSKAEKWMANRPEKSRRSAFIKTEREYRNIEFDQILYVAGMKDYVLIYLASEPEPIVTHITLKAIEEKLPSDMFMRVHRSYIVALDKITAIDSCGDILIDKISVPVSDSYRKEIEKHVKENLLAR